MIGNADINHLFTRRQNNFLIFDRSSLTTTQQHLLLCDAIGPLNLNLNCFQFYSKHLFVIIWIYLRYFLSHIIEDIFIYIAQNKSYMLNNTLQMMIPLLIKMSFGHQSSKCLCVKSYTKSTWLLKKQQHKYLFSVSLLLFFF